MMFAWLGCWFPFKPFKHWERFTNLWEAVLPDAIFFKVAAKERGCFFQFQWTQQKRDYKMCCYWWFCYLYYDHEDDDDGDGDDDDDGDSKFFTIFLIKTAIIWHIPFWTITYVFVSTSLSRDNIP